MSSAGKKIAGGLASSIGLLLLMAEMLRGKKKRNRLYQLDARRSIAFSTICFVADIWAISAILRAKPSISAAELEQVSAHGIPCYDCIALHQRFGERNCYKHLSDNVLRGIIAVSVLLLLRHRNRNVLLLLFAEAQAATYTYYTFSPLGPAFQDKYRPVVYYKNEPVQDRDAGNNRNARYSGHTGNAAAATFFLAKAYAGSRPGMSSWMKAVVYALACLPPVALGYLRMKALKHFPSDVALAIGIGGAFGLAVPELHRRSVS